MKHSALQFRISRFETPPKKIVDNPDKSGRVVRKIAVQVAVFMLFFALISCEKADYPFEYEEPEIEVPSEPIQPEIPEVFTSRFFISKSIGRLLMYDQLSSGRVVEPVNLSEEFRQQGMYVQATVRRTGEANQHGNPFVEITQIQETDIRGMRMIVRRNSDGEYVLYRDRWSGFVSECGVWYSYTMEAAICIRMVPTNLSEEFQIDGIRVQVEYRYIKRLESSQNVISFLIEIVEIHEFLRRGTFYVRKTDRLGYIFLISRHADFEGWSETVTHRVPINLPEEFQVEGLYVQVAFHRRGVNEEGFSVIKIVEIYEVGTRAQTRIIGGSNARIVDHPCMASALHYTWLYV